MYASVLVIEVPIIKIRWDDIQTYYDAIKAYTEKQGKTTITTMEAAGLFRISPSSGRDLIRYIAAAYSLTFFGGVLFLDKSMSLEDAKAYVIQDRISKKFPFEDPYDGDERI